MKKIASSKSKAPKAKATVFKIQLPTAKKVNLTGDFNNWDTGNLSLKKDPKGLWSIKVDLVPGRHEYKFVVDGQWVNDPAAGAVYNTYGSHNSVIDVK